MKPRLSIIGLGHLGAPMYAVFVRAGFEVVGVDKDRHKVRGLSMGKAPVYEPFLQEWLSLQSEYHITSNVVSAMGKTEVTFVVVPTPSQEDGKFSLEYIEDVLFFGIKWGIIEKHKTGSNLPHHIVITSTVNPGDMTKLNEFMIHEGLVPGEDYTLWYNPEFIALGSVIKNFTEPDYILIGEPDNTAGFELIDIYRKAGINAPVKQMSWENAELTKLCQNVYLDLKIDYANTLAELCDKIPGTDVNVILDAIGTDSRVGNKFLHAGPPLSGPCLPRDARALYATMVDHGYEPKLFEAIDLSSAEWRWYLRVKIIELIDWKDDQTVVAILGISYKPGTNLTTESFGVFLSEALAYREMCQQRHYDPLVTDAIEGIPLYRTLEGALDGAQIVVITHPSLPEPLTEDHLRGKVVFDLWGIARHLRHVCARYIQPGVSDASGD